MLNFPRWKIFLILLVCLVGAYFALPNVLGSETREKLGGILPANTMNLGLDLRGGSYLLLEVNFNAYLADQKEQLVDNVRKQLRDAKLGYQGLASTPEGVKFTLRDAADADAVKDALKSLFSEVELDISDTLVTTRYRESAIQDMQKRVLEQSIEIVRRRVDETGTREPIIQRQGDNRILLQVPGLDNPEHLKQLLGKTAKMSFHLMDEANPYPMEARHSPPGEMLLKDKEGRMYLVKKRIELGGEMLIDSQPSFDKGEPVVSFRFNNQGGRKFADITRENAGKPFAIVLDGEVITAPRINEPIMGGSGIISGSFTVQSANDLSLLLRAGALPAPLMVMEERSVGPSLGADSIEAGKNAAFAGAGLVVVIMILCYGLFGLFASVAMVVNMVLIVALLSMLQATLTMPGIAGMVLTMGMAVDTNVLIYERMREEIRIGRTPFSAIEQGFRHAYGTIIDTHITTLISGMLLYMMGSGAVKGFAVTLSAGIICSLFTAVLFTRMMIVVWLKKTRPKTLNV